MVALTLETAEWYRIILQWYNVAFIWTTMSQISFVVLTLAAVMYIWHVPVFKEAMSEDQGYVGAVVCPAEFDILKDEEEGTYTVTGTAEIQDVTWTLEIHYQSTQAFGNKSNSGTFPSRSVKVTKSKTSRKHCPTSDQNDLTKTHTILHFQQKETMYK